MRRTTLGNLNLGNQGRRLSRDKSSVGAGGRPKSTFSGRPSSSGRPSTASARPSFANGKSRRSSQYGRDTYSQIKDPRPLSDKGYQQKMIKTLMQFLTEFSYPHQVSLRVLSAPAMKEFRRIFEFMYQYINPDPQGMVAIEKKPEEEVPRIFKMLGYPFNISKSNMYSVGSPHTWPMILGALCWLIELIRHAVDLSQDTEALILFPKYAYEDDEYKDDSEETARLFFECLEKSYNVFLDGRELDDMQDFDEEFKEKSRKRNEALFAENEMLDEENLQLEKELYSLQNDPSELETLVQQRSTLTSDREKFVTYIKELGKHKKQLEEIHKQQEEEMEAMKMEQAALTQENEKLQTTLNHQELSAVDVARMKTQKQGLQKTVEMLENDRDHLDQQIWDKEMQYAKKHETTEKYIREYNDMARRLKLVPRSAENSGGVDFEMHFNPYCEFPDQRVHVDFRGTIKPALLRLKQQTSEKIREIQSSTINEEEALDQITDMVNENQEECNTLENKITTLDRDIEWKKEIMDQEYQKASTDAQTLEEEIKQMKLKCQADVDLKQRELSELKLKAEERSEEMKALSKEYSQFLLDVCQLVFEHKIKIQNRIAEFQEDADRALKEASEFEVPVPTILV